MDEVKTDRIDYCIEWSYQKVPVEIRDAATSELAALKERIAELEDFVETRDASINALLTSQANSMERIEELENDDTVPRSRYDVCNKDWIEERDKCRNAERIINSRDDKIRDLEQQLRDAEERGYNLAWDYMHDDSDDNKCDCQWRTYAETCAYIKARAAQQKAEQEQEKNK